MLRVQTEKENKHIPNGLVSMVSVCMAAYVVGVYVILTWFKDPVSICRFLLAYLQTAIDVKSLNGSIVRQ